MKFYGYRIICPISYFIICFPLFLTNIRGVTGGILDSLSNVIGELYCDRISCCDFHLNDRNTATEELRENLSKKLYGQPIAQALILEAVISHLLGNPVKALSIGMHGWTGTGKNYVARMIADSIYKKGILSPIVHVFAGRTTFPDPKDVITYKKNLVNWISGNVTKCRHSMFIFDECDKMPPDILDVVVPFIDHHATLQHVQYRNAIFLFLTNEGGIAIKDTLLELYEHGKTREELGVMDFHNEITINLFNGDGGFSRSDMIRGDAIDFYVPFLPLEAKHLRLCIIDEFKRRGLPGVNEGRIQEILEDFQFGPTDHPIFSVTGCKRVQSLVTNNLAIRKRKISKQEL